MLSRFIAVFLFSFGTLTGTFSFAQTPNGDSLTAAVRAGRFDRVKHFITSGVDANARDRVGNTALHSAALSKNIDIATFLISHGADVNVPQGQTGQPPLDYAVVTGTADTVKLLLSNGARVDLRDHALKTPLHYAVERGYADIIELLVSRSHDIDAVDATGHTPLDDAVLYDRSSVIPLILARGADPNRARDVDGRTPLHQACIKGFADLIQPLISHGADPNRLDKWGQSPLDLALAYKNRPAVVVLLSPQTGWKQSQAAAQIAMESAVLRGQTETVSLLLQSGIDLRKPTNSGSTYLHDAAFKGQEEMVRFLLDRGADVNALNRAGGTPLHDAALGGRTDVINILLDHGAKVDARDGESDATPLMLAASLGRTEAVALLLQHGANVELRDRKGRTALDRAKEVDDPCLLKLLETSATRSKPAHAA